MSNCLRDIAEVIMGQSPPGETCNTTEEGLPLLNGPTEFGSFHPSPVQFTTDPKRVSSRGDLLFCVRGSTTGRMNWSDQTYALGRGLAAIRPKNGNRFSSFLKGCIEVCLPTLLMGATGSTFPSVSREQIEDISVEIPSDEDLKRIENILGTLDDKIELNRKTNETLEAMANALFKSWFVDFDPVRAKAEGRPTGLPADISDLFPDSFEDSELGEIPSGWSVEALSDIAQISTGKRPVSVAESRSSANNIPVYGGAGVMGYTCSALTDGEPILTTGRVGTLGVVNRVIEKVWISDNTLIINPGRINFVYVYFFLLRQDLKSLNRGSTQPLLSQTELKSLPIARPPASVLSVFCELTQHWQERQSTLLKENVNIKALLDTLLPKLISGEIRIPDAEKMLEEVDI